MHICISNLTIISSDNGLLPGRCQAIIWPIAGNLLIGPLGTNSSEIIITIHKFSFKKMHLKMAAVKWRPFCLNLSSVLLRHVSWDNFWHIMEDFSYQLRLYDKNLFLKTKFALTFCSWKLTMPFFMYSRGCYSQWKNGLCFTWTAVLIQVTEKGW